MLGEVFSEALKQAVGRTLSIVDLLSVTHQLASAGESTLSAALYRTWIEHNGDNGLLHIVLFNYGVTLNAMGDGQGARAAFTLAIQRNPDFFPPYINLGGVLERLGAGGDAVLTWQQVANRLPTVTGENVEFKTGALKQIARVLERANFDPQAEEALQVSLELNRHQSDVVQHFVSLRQRQCKWPVMAPFAQCDRRTLLSGISALSLAAYTDDPFLQLGNAYRYWRYTVGVPPVSFADRHVPPARPGADTRRRRIGYLSSDLREHAVGYLTSEVYELHDRAKVEVFAYYCGIASPDSIQARIKGAVEHWVDISGWDDATAAQRMIDDGIEILVDLNGYTDGQRSTLLAMRPAPVIVNWLGFPGTMASPCHNYIIADPFIIPPEHELFFSEKVLRLPCYQANDRKRVVSDARPSRSDWGLPDDAFVFCCFNALHKITRHTWARWMTILNRVPGSVLWLLDGPETTMARLRELAQAAGIAPERLIFARKVANRDHLARYPLADLFLDTQPYGAHTTSSDALWMGVPVVTLAGRCFASRVCGSLVTAAGLPELVCTTPAQFVDLAVALVGDRSRLADLRQRLAANRDRCVLFDMPLLVGRLEALYAQMWADYCAGRLPQPDLSNLDIYHDIGVELDDDEVEMLAVPDYTGRYRDVLAQKSKSLFLNPDPRLWPGPAFRYEGLAKTAMK